MEKKTTPFITVIIAAYNRKAFLKEAIASALDQTLPRSKYEIVVIKNFRDKDIDSYPPGGNLIVMPGNTNVTSYFFI